MTPEIIQGVRSIVSEMLNSQQSPYSLAKVPQHTHNGVDAPFEYQSTFSYIGLIGLSGEVGILPSGWSAVAFVDAGGYQITHNLNTFAYSVVVTPITSQYIPSVTPGSNVFDVNFISTNNSLVSVPFFFILTAIMNKSFSPPSYQPTEYMKKGILV